MEVRRESPAWVALASTREISGSWLMKASVRLVRCQFRKVLAPQIAAIPASGPKNEARREAAMSQSAATEPTT